jgi:hypothetical protein
VLIVPIVIFPIKKGGFHAINTPKLKVAQAVTKGWPNIAALTYLEVVTCQPKYSFRFDILL